jgi:hypothetical protein
MLPLSLMTFEQNASQEPRDVHSTRQDHGVVFPSGLAANAVCEEFTGNIRARGKHQGTESRVKTARAGVGGCKTRRIMAGLLTRRSVAVVAAGISVTVVQI